MSGRRSTSVCVANDILNTTYVRQGICTHRKTTYIDYLLGTLFSLACLVSKENLSEGGLAQLIGSRFKKGCVLLYYEYSSPEFESSLAVKWNGMEVGCKYAVQDASDMTQNEWPEVNICMCSDGYFKHDKCASRNLYPNTKLHRPLSQHAV